MYYADEMTERAVAKFVRHCKRQGDEPPAPCRYSSGREDDLVVLRNAGGELARYRIRPDGSLRRIKPVVA